MLYENELLCVTFQTALQNGLSTITGMMLFLHQDAGNDCKIASQMLWLQIRYTKGLSMRQFTVTNIHHDPYHSSQTLGDPVALKTDPAATHAHLIF